MKTYTIGIQVNTNDARTWDDCKVSALTEIEKPIEVAESIAIVTGSTVRLTYALENFSINQENVGRLNGHYFQPHINPKS